MKLFDSAYSLGAGLLAGALALWCLAVALVEWRMDREERRKGPAWWE